MYDKYRYIDGLLQSHHPHHHLNPKFLYEFGVLELSNKEAQHKQQRMQPHMKKKIDKHKLKDIPVTTTLREETIGGGPKTLLLPAGKEKLRQNWVPNDMKDLRETRNAMFNHNGETSLPQLCPPFCI